jgi:AcrR family transcriptional regulator
LAKKSDRTKQRIIQAANRLFYRRGFNRTSFTDIVDASGVPRGNIYYYYRTKEEILLAALEHRMRIIDNMLHEWDRKFSNPLDRLKRFVRVMVAGDESTALYGCPMGSLNMELGKDQLELQSHASQMFRRFMDYFRQQFEAMGYPPQRARYFSLQLMERAQGVSMMTHVLREPQIMQDARAELEHWLETISPTTSTSHTL